MLLLEETPQTNKGDGRSDCRLYAHDSSSEQFITFF